MRIATALNKTLDERRDTIVDFFAFIRDFNKLDTSPLIERVLADDKFLEAVEAIVATAVGPWKAIDALRDFAVQALFGEQAPVESLAERARPRLSPFAVPYAFLRAMAPNPSQFDPHRLRSLTVADAIDVTGLVGEERGWETRVPGGEAWLVTTVWARMLPRQPTKTHVTITDYSDNRILHDSKLWTMIEEPLPAFWWLHHHTPLNFRFTRQQQEAPHSLLIAVEGWRYTLG